MFSLIKSKEQHAIDAEHVENRREAFRESMLVIKPPLEEEIDPDWLKQTLETVSSHIKFIWNGVVNVRLDKAKQIGALSCSMISVSLRKSLTKSEVNAEGGGIHPSF
ncbi:MAG: hypothetical protein GY824_26135 [Delftia sp.]|nr:hypothetical protein [Delftia sp.]